MTSILWIYENKTLSFSSPTKYTCFISISIAFKVSFVNKISKKEIQTNSQSQKEKQKADLQLKILPKCKDVQNE